jgi:hypothetical protein
VGKTVNSGKQDSTIWITETWTLSSRMLFQENASGHGASFQNTFFENIILRTKSSKFLFIHGTRVKQYR